ncbi:MAG: 5-formyltetrahydrofolate cyclo-ligase [Bernardetiaceae bacterium]|jgi:5-formyltetrahydrofolate cyclo-ligase|nr:5-formyltetrahydrofolate cyclo-ligase [Bernardetiaceae bacterium]
MSQPGPGQTKADLRRHYLAARRGLAADWVQQASQAIADRFFAEFLAGPLPENAWLHLFLPIAGQNEVDTWPIVRRCWAEWPQVSLAVPQVQPDRVTMRQLALLPGCPVAPGPFGVPVPAQPVPAPEASLAWVLLPLLSFDERGYRVGYGKGHYDRFLARLDPQVQRIGLSLFPAGPPVLDPDRYDIRLTACLTPDKVWRWPQVE